MATPPTNQPIPLHLGVQENILHGKVFYEKINANRVKELANYNGLIEKWNSKKYSQEKASQFYKNEQDQLLNYFKNFKKKKGGVSVRYMRAHKSKIGRVYPFRSLGLTCISKKTRNTIINNEMIDLDLKNAQPEILRNICHSNNIPCRRLDEYNNNREPILEEMMERYDVNRNACKKLFIRMTLGGTFWGFCYDNNVDKKTNKPTVFIDDYQKELDEIGKYLKDYNEELYRSTKLSIDKQNKQIKENNKINSKYNEENPNMPPKKIQREKSAYGSFLSKILQEWEVRIIECMYLHLKDNTNIVNGDFFVYEYDGIKLIRERVEKYGINELINELMLCVKEKMQFNIVLEEKDMDKVFEDFNCEVIPNSIDKELYEYDSSSYDNMKEEFEEENFKVMSNDLFMMKMTDGTYQFKKKNSMITTYEHLQVDIIKKDRSGAEIIEQKSFISMWMKDPHMKKYNNVGIYPPPLEPPKKVYNLWRPFRGDELIKNYTPVPDAIDKFKTHFLKLCDNNEDVSSYFIKWVAQLIQFPAIKTNVPIFTGGQGCGKGTAMTLIKKLIGEDKYFKTSNPERDVWGTFNSLMANSFFIQINELEKKQMMKSLGIIKELITDSELTINPKGLTPYEITSFHRFSMTTNKEDPFVTHKDDRRTYIIKCSNELIDNKEYFDNFYKMINDDNSIATIYDYLKNLEGIDKFLDIPKPITSYQQTLQDINTDIIDSFMINFTTEHYYDEKRQFEISSSEIYTEFKNYCKKVGVEGIMSSQKFHGRITLRNIKGIEEGLRSNKGRKKKIDIPLLIEHFNIVCDVKEIDEIADEYDSD